jgi:predicted AAA+ superfamily ATPase
MTALDSLRGLIVIDEVQRHPDLFPILRVLLDRRPVRRDFSSWAAPRFWTMTAHYSGGIWNSSEIGRSLGEAHTTVKRHLDALSAALVVRVLEPWCANVGKRLVKSPKVYIRDSGLLHTLLGIGERRQLEGHPVVGGSWEGFVIEQLLAHLPKANAYYWRTQAGAELDLLLFLKGRRIGIEIKRADAPKMTASMGSALEDLELHRLLVVYPGSKLTTQFKSAKSVLERSHYSIDRFIQVNQCSVYDKENDRRLG